MPQKPSLSTYVKPAAQNRRDGKLGLEGAEGAGWHHVCDARLALAVPGVAARRIDETNAHTVHMTMGELAAACGQDGQFCTMECEAQDEGNAKRRKS